MRVRSGRPIRVSVRTSTTAACVGDSSTSVPRTAAFQSRRTIRFVWPCEVECTIALLNARPEVPKRTLATIHLDMIGGNSDITHGTLKVEGSPPSLTSFVSDVGFAIGRWVDDQSRLYAERGEAAMPLLDPDGTKNALHARIGGFSEGSDHQVWAEGSWRVPVIYIADWPDIYIHTDKDVPANLDSTKMKRAIFIAASSAWYLANVGPSDSAALGQVIGAEAQIRSSAGLYRVMTSLQENGWTVMSGIGHDAAVLKSFRRFGLDGRRGSTSVLAQAGDRPARLSGEAAVVYRRNADLKGPMDGFGYSWLDDHLKQAGLPKPALLAREASEDGPSFGYETLNLVDGRRSVQEIRDTLAATVAPVPVEEVAAYLATLERLGVLRR